MGAISSLSHPNARLPSNATLNISSLVPAGHDQPAIIPERGQNPSAVVFQPPFAGKLPKPWLAWHKAIQNGGNTRGKYFLSADTLCLELQAAADSFVYNQPTLEKLLMS